MSRFIFIACLTTFVAIAPISAHQIEDVVHLKNGKIVRGTITEQILGESLEIQTQDGSIFVYSMDEITKIVKEPATGAEETGANIEIGTLFGLSHLSFDGDDEATVIGVPSAMRFAHFGNPSLYVSWFPTKKLSIGPEFSFGRLSTRYNAKTSLYLGGRGAFFFHSNAVSSPYLLGHGAMLLVDETVIDGSEVPFFSGAGLGFFAGVGLGYQFRLGSALVLRAEGRYRRWFAAAVDGYVERQLFGDIPNDELSLMLGLGIKTGRAVLKKDAPAPVVEIGTLFGLSHSPSEGFESTAIGVPSAIFGGAGNPSLYVSWFPTEKLSIGAEFGFGRTSGSKSLFGQTREFARTSLYLGGRGAFFPQGNAMSGPYLLGHGARSYIKIESSSATNFSAGVGLGYRWHIEPAFSLRTEGRYRRWLESESNTFSLMLGLGTRLGGR